MIKDNVGIKGKVKVFIRKKGEGWRLVRETNNMCVTAGLNLIRDRIATNSSSYIQYGAIGSGTTAPTAADTALESEILRKTFQNVDTSTDKQVTFEYWIASTEGNTPGTVSEVGLFTASTGGTMLCRATFDAITKDNTVEMLIVWTVSFADA